MRANKQRGATLTSTIITVFIAGFFLTLVFKLGPHYLDNRIIAGAIQQVGQSDLDDETIPDIRRKVSDFFTINNIRDVPANQVFLDKLVEIFIRSHFIICQISTPICLSLERNFTPFAFVP